MENNQILRLEEITKEFPGVKALDNVHLEIASGEVHALCGENGAGKSTLMKIISGAQSFTSGKMFFEGESVQFKTTREAQDSGISMIYQEFNLIPELSVAENLFIGRVPVNQYGKVNWKKLDSDAQGLLKRVGLEISTKQLISELTIGEAQMVEIAKCLSSDAKLIIMDEPTASLTDKEIEFLFQIVENLKKQGISIIYISHRLDEIFEITDRITVFRDGKYIATRMTSETTHDELVSMMVGKDIRDLYPERKVAINKDAVDVLQVEHANDHQKIHDVSLEVKAGEIVGIAGLLGSGNIRIGKLISGYYGEFDGQVAIKGKTVHIHTPGDALQAGISCVSDDRKIEGLVLIRSVKENISLASLHQLLKKGIFSSIDKTKENQVVDQQIERLNIKVSSSDQITGNLSGGNQQKVVFGKMLETAPKLLILNEPTRGIDIGAKAEIYQIMRELSEQGIGIILASSELPELIGMSDRALVMREGRIVKELKNEDLTQEKVLLYAAGGMKDE